MKSHLFTFLFCLSLSVPVLADNLSHWQRLAKNRSANAQFNLGVMYANGEGVEQSEIESYVWWYIAATSGNRNIEKNETMLLID